MKPSVDGLGPQRVISPALHPDARLLADLVERFVAEITGKDIRRGAFHSVVELERAVLEYIRAQPAWCTLEERNAT